MATYTIDKIEFGSNVYNIEDANALPKSGGTVTGPVIFGDSVSMTEVTTGNIVVTGNASVTNNIQANTINGVTVGSSPKFTDTTYSSLAAASGGTAVSLVTTGEKYTWNNKGSGSVTSITAGAGLSGGTITTSGTIAHSNSVTAQTTQNVYPIKIDAQGHISAYGTAIVNSAAASGGTTNSLVTTGEKYIWNNKKDAIIAQHDYTGVIASANTDAGGTFMFLKIRPTTFNTSWSVKGKIYATTDYSTLYTHNTEFFISGNTNAYRAYANLNVRHPDAHLYYYTVPYCLKEAGYNSGYSHYFGVNLRYSSNQTNTSWKRNFHIEIWETSGCTIEFLNTMTAIGSVDGYGSTNYNSYWNLNAVDQGLQETGDSNDVNYYNRQYYTYRKAKNATVRYALFLPVNDEYMLSTTSVNNTVAATKTMTTEKFDPFRSPILYWNSTTTYAAEANIGEGAYDEFLGDIRYAFNVNTSDTITLVGRKPLYLVCTPSDDGMATLAAQPLSHTLPVSEDGLYYIYLGTIYPDSTPYRLYLVPNHPVYKYINGEVIEVNRKSLDSNTVSGHTVLTNVPSGAVFTDTKNTAGSTDTSSKIFLIGATSQAANPQTYSHDTAYVGTNGKLYSGGNVVLTGGSNASSTVSITPSTTNVYSMTSAGSVTAGTANVPTVIDTSKFSGGSFTRGTFSGGSFTQGTDSFTANTPTAINTSKFSGGSFTRGTFSGGSFTRGTFSQGTLPTLTFAMDTTDTAQLNITFGQGTLPTHAADSFTPASHAADSFTPASLQSGFYTAGTAASFTQGTDSFTAATHAADSFTAAKLNSGFYTAGTANTPTAVTLPGRSSAIAAWTGYTAATAAAQTFTGTS